MVDITLKLFWGGMCGVHDQSMSCSVISRPYVVVEKAFNYKASVPLYPKPVRSGALGFCHSGKNVKTEN
jgi:hypothetical protein